MPVTASSVRSKHCRHFCEPSPLREGSFLIFREINGLPLSKLVSFHLMGQNRRFWCKYAEETARDLTLIKSGNTQKEHHSPIRKALELSTLVFPCNQRK